MTHKLLDKIIQIIIYRRPRRWTVEAPPVVCPVPLCPYEAQNVSNLFRHMAARHPWMKSPWRGILGTTSAQNANNT